jgi:hypothetical protein
MATNQKSLKTANSATNGKSQPSKRAGTKTEVVRAAADSRAAIRHQQARRQERWERSQPVLGTLGLVAAALVLFFSLAGGPSTTGAQVAPPAVVKGVTQVSTAVFTAVQTGGITNPLQAVPNTPILTDAAGKPEIVYIGAEYCPFCAAERWSMIVALSRFGTFQGLRLTTSSSSDNYRDTPTFTFVDSTYTSQYIDFIPKEIQDRVGNTLQTLSAAEQQLLTKYDAPPYTQSAGGIPFIDIANQQLAISSGYSPAILTNLSWQQIATDLNDPSSTIAQQVIGNANYLTAAICQATDQKPASVCQAAPIPTISQKLGH